MDDESSDHTLLAAWRAGNTRAGNLLVARHWMMLQRFFALKVVPDVVQDLISRTWETIIRISIQGHHEGDDAPSREVQSVRAHFLAFARFTLLRHYRERRREEGKRLDENLDTIESLAPSLSRQLSWIRKVELFEIVLQGLPLDLQAVFEAREVERLRGSELAEMFGICEETVRSRLHRAREMLKERLAMFMQASTTSPGAQR